SLLLMHHPPSWLSARARKDFLATIYTPERFALCLHGHLHRARSKGLAEAGGPPRYYFQAPSLFGLEHYGTSRERHAFGYAWGRISATGEVRVWPLVRVVRGDGAAAFVHDPKFYGDATSGFELRPPDRVPGGEPPPPPPPDAALGAYRHWARERHRGLSLIGVGGGELQLRIEEVYVPLRISQRPLHPDLDGRAAKRRGDMALECGTGDLELEEIFSRPQAGGPHVAIFGDPGAGKTTALVKLHHHCLAAGPESLGLADGTVPVLLRLRRLREADLDSPLEKVIGRELAETSGGELAAELGRRLGEHGRLLLLLDGLDEIADAALRARVCKYLEWQLTGGERQHVRAVVSCRYSGYGGGVRLDERFLHLDVRPLDAEQCRHLVRLWFREVQRTLPDYPESDAREAAEGLVAALDGADYRAQRLKVLVGSPLLLTLLCVVVLRGGEMPRHRAAFYEQCLRVLLGQWSRSKAGKTEKDWQPAVDADTALAILRPLAYALHARQRRDDLSAPELVLHVEERLDELGKSASAFEVIEWLHREAGVLDEYAPLHYGFVHLGLQEYLTALEVAAHGPETLDELCAHCGDEWWREVLLLLVGLPGRRLFAPLMERLLRSNAVLEEA
ncbi:MAG: NACHT domain-containing protein, partial [bacterium]|nr:NACHT domain-containing protein [bacterium]